jgi:hypothetical protein
MGFYGGLYSYESLASNKRLSANGKPSEKRHIRTRHEQNGLLGFTVSVSRFPVARCRA